MKNDIYDLLNDIDNQIDTFETVDITSTDLANAVAYYMGQTTDLNDEGLAMETVFCFKEKNFR